MQRCKSVWYNNHIHTMLHPKYDNTILTMKSYGNGSIRSVYLLNTSRWYSIIIYQKLSANWWFFSNLTFSHPYWICKMFVKDLSLSGESWLPKGLSWVGIQPISDCILHKPQERWQNVWGVSTGASKTRFSCANAHLIHFSCLKLATCILYEYLFKANTYQMCRATISELACYAD